MKKNESNYIRNNWGWNGLNNGYFISGSFNSNETPLLSNIRSGIEGNYQYENTIYPFLTR